jgi:hypothetical protein
MFKIIIEAQTVTEQIQKYLPEEEGTSKLLILIIFGLA